MSVAKHLGGAAVIFALVFAAAAFAGSRIDVHPGRDAARDSMSGHGGGDGAMHPVRGLAVSEDGLTLELEPSSAPRDRAFALRLRVAGADGATVRDFDIEHARRMHVIVVRRDLSGFQHLHPVQEPDGSWSVPARLPDAGTYRVFADFTIDGEPHTLAGDLTVDGPTAARLLPRPVRSVGADGLRVTLGADTATAGEESALTFSVTRRGAPVAVEPYLGAKGHLVALRRGDLAFLHVHPDERRLSFDATFPSPGTYRMFLQFKTAGRIHTAAFTQVVGR